MKAVSGLVATALLLALTIAGGVLLYNYVYGYLAGGGSSGGVEAVYVALYDYGSVKELYAEVLNTGLKTVRVEKVVLIQNGKPINETNISGVSIPAGGKVAIVVSNITANINASQPLYLRIYYDGQPSKLFEVFK
ncbi:hypothetical protein IMZ38_01765 [Thermosphaera chiliense]|uniref:DUF973 family protein n=1 Tax=Thermosphaera chiliense TaxID=3402707 RepID=A0A7M1USY6_9CREN|nr:hypothetical protein [Thermosphaera aggregans]QOR94687.1 hypothetical protein IMZ38_01765 [Thermosphaera aggregans]